ncbi:MAG: transposase [Deltaproteobacteria bacterium]|nr:transposase [Deltaproteobacteria bacterium]
MSRRFYDPALLHMVSLATIDRRWALVPEDRALQSEIVGALAAAQRETGVRVHAFTFMSNHYHGLYSFDYPEQFGAFLCQFHAATSRLVNRAFGRRGPMWHPRAHVKAVLPGEASELTALKYVLLQACKAGLAPHPCAWPGASSARWLLEGKPLIGRHVRQTEWTLAGRNGKDSGPAEDFAEDLAVAMTPLPCFAGLAEDTWRQQLVAIVADLCQTATHDEALASENARHCVSGEKYGHDLEWADLPTSPQPERKPHSPCIAPDAQAEAAYCQRLKQFLDACAAACACLRLATMLAAQGRPAQHVDFPAFAFPAAARATPIWRGATGHEPAHPNENRQ